MPDDARLLREEIFGPVAPIATFSTEEQALAAANLTEYGLVAYVYTRDLARAFRVCEGIETGMVGLNQGVVSNAAAPFGGVKQSGFGREGGFEGIAEYLETKYVADAAFEELCEEPLAEHAEAEQRAEQHDRVDRLAALLGPVVVFEVQPEGELVERERSAGAVDDRGRRARSGGPLRCRSRAATR